MSELDEWSDFCYNAPDKFFKHSDTVLNTINPPAGSVSSGLSKNIWDTFLDNKQTDLEFSNKMNLWNRLNRHIKTEYSDHGLFMAGSTLNGFGLKNSDADFSFLSELPKTLEKSISITKLQLLSSCLKKYEHIVSFELIPAAVPLINMTEKLYKLTIDINYNATANIRNTYLLYSYSQVDWRVRPLVIAIKLWAKFHNIIDARYGSLSSYPLILMVIHYLQCGVTPAVLPNFQSIFKDKFNSDCDIKKINFFEKINIPASAFSTSNNDSLDKLLIGFFKYYNNFDFSQHVISVRKGAKILWIEYMIEHISEPDQMYDKKFINIEEPFNLSNVGRTVHKYNTYEKIKKLFALSYQKLEKTHNLCSIFDKSLF